MMTDVKKKKFLRLLVSYSILVFIVVAIIYPLLWTVGASFNPGNSLISTSIIPKNPTFDHYRELFAGKESLQYGQWYMNSRSEEHTSELQSRENLVCRLLLE